MPEAEPFTALGRGNGFPFCPERVDVDDFDDWITLGGYRKGDAGSPTAEQINDSLIAAMKFYWMMSAVKFSASASASASSPSTTASAASSGATGDQIENTSDVKTPAQRVCGSAGNRSSMLPYLEDENEDDFFDSGPEFIDLQLSQASTYIEASFTDPDDENLPQGVNSYLSIGLVVAMYNGEEFVGYGIESGTFTETSDPEIVAAIVLANASATNYFPDFDDSNNDVDDYALSRKAFYYSLNSIIPDTGFTLPGLAEPMESEVVVNAVVKEGMHFLEAVKTVEVNDSDGATCSASSSVSFTLTGFEFYTFT